MSSNLSRLTKNSAFYPSVGSSKLASDVVCSAAVVSALVGSVRRCEDGSKSSAKHIDVVMDTGSDGHLLPTSVMTDVRKTPEGTYCGGVGQGREPLTHTGYVESLGGWRSRQQTTHT